MNKVQLVGRLTRDPETRQAQANGTMISRFSVAVNRRIKREGEPDADFLNCVAFGKTAEFISKYFVKGMAIGIVGRIQTGKYTNNAGATVYTTDIIVEEAEFVEKKSESTPSPAPTEHQGGYSYNAADDDLPF